MKCIWYSHGFGWTRSHARVVSTKYWTRWARLTLDSLVIFVIFIDHWSLMSIVWFDKVCKHAHRLAGATQGDLGRREKAARLRHRSEYSLIFHSNRYVSFFCRSCRRSCVTDTISVPLIWYKKSMPPSARREFTFTFILFFVLFAWWVSNFLNWNSFSTCTFTLYFRLLACIHLTCVVHLLYTRLARLARPRPAWIGR